MVRAFLLALALLSTSVAIACPCVGNDEPCVCGPECKCESADVSAEAQADASYGVRYTKERLLSLPKDQDKFYLSIVGNETDPKFNEIKGWFSENRELKNIKVQTHYNAVTTTSAIYKERYAKNIPATPLIRIQTAKGTTLFQVSGENVPMSAEALTKSINQKVMKGWRDRFCPFKPDVEPEPEPTPDADPDADVDADGPDVQPDVTPVDASFPWLVLVGATLGAALIGGGWGLGKSMYDTYRVSK